MKLEELDLLEFLPGWMGEDQSARGMAYALERQIRRTAGEIGHLAVYHSVDTQGDAILDELAWQFNIPEYRSDLPLETKRKLVRSAILTHRTRGTAAAVERVATDIFGESRVEEWFQYGGEPYYFRIHTTNVSAGDEEAAAFEAAVAVTQNVRSVLEAVIIEAVERGSLGFGGGLRIADSIYL